MPDLPPLQAAITSFFIGAALTWLWLRGRYLSRIESLEKSHAQSVLEVKYEARELERRLDDCKEQMSRLDAALMQARQDSVKAREQVARLQTIVDLERPQAEEKQKLLDEARIRMTHEFKILANEIFEDKQKTFVSQNRQQLTGLLDPLGKRIREFEKRVEETYNRESKERFSLTREIRNLQQLNERISVDAVNLTNALKGQVKTRGVWGEVILERVLEKSGLEKGREYDIQVSHPGQHSERLQPDVIVHLPDDKDIVIDSKVSLIAYERYIAADDPTEQAAQIADHVRSIKNHVRDLSGKNYQLLETLRTLDFVLMFIPIEAAFSLALEQDQELFSEALAKNIVLVTPTTLLATLRTIQNIWRYEQQNRNARLIAEGAGRLYDKFVGFVGDLDEIGARINATQASYERAHNKLVSGRGNLVKRAEDMRKLGARVSKKLESHLIEADEDDDEETPSGD